MPLFSLPEEPMCASNRPFVLITGDQCAPPAPEAFSELPEAAFYLEAQEVYQTVNNLSDEQIEIANFWSDDAGATATPGGHSISILTQVLRQEHAELGLAAEAYARMGIAITDAFIGCWNISTHRTLWQNG